MRELTMNEVDEVTGGNISTGIAFIGLGLAFAVAAGVAPLAVGAAVVASPLVAVGSIASVTAGGYNIGAGISDKERC